MDQHPDNMLEAFARVVSVEGTVAWLEPEPKTSCGSCTSLTCSTGSLASHIMARRFPLANDENFVVGERIVVGVYGNALLKAALIAYGIPLVMMLVCAITAQWALQSDGITLMASVLGLVIGFGIAHFVSAYLAHHELMAPYFMRRAENCQDQNNACYAN